MPKPWMLPLFAAGIAVPVSAGFLLGGPAVGLAVGALAVATILIVAARMRPDDPIEVAPTQDQGSRVLVVALATVDDPQVAGRVAEIAEGERPLEEVLVLAPALNRPAAHWTSDLREARFDAQRRLALTIGTLATAEVEARGQVGDSDPAQAIEDTLRTFAAARVVFVTRASGAEKLIERVGSRLRLPVSEVRAPG
jgi:hypothetical protein